MEKCGLFYSMSQGLNKDEADFRLRLYGPNSVLVDKKPVWKIALETVSLIYLTKTTAILVLVPEKIVPPALRNRRQSIFKQDLTGNW